MFQDPPHQPHVTRILPGTVLDQARLCDLDRPRQETPWCLQHDARMAQRSVHPPGERIDYRYATVVRASSCCIGCCCAQQRVCLAFCFIRAHVLCCSDAMPHTL